MLEVLKRALDRPMSTLFAVRRDLFHVPVSVRLWWNDRIWVPVRLSRILRSAVAKEALARDLFFQEYTPRLQDTVLDIGAGAGEITPLLSRCVGPSGRVYAVEGHPSSFDALVQTCEGLGNVTPVNLAITDRRGTVHMTTGDLLIENRLIESGGVEVNGVTLDEFIAEHAIASADLVIMNIEGAEVRALEGMRGSVPIVRNLTVACHDFLARRDGHYRTKERVRRLLNEYGYEVKDRWIGDHRPYARHYLYARHR